MLNALTILSWFAFLAVGCVLGWLIRSRRSQAEKAAINDGWREQLDAQGVERKRIEHQNRSLMRQVSELQLKLTGRGRSEQQDAQAKPESDEQRAQKSTAKDTTAEAPDTGSGERLRRANKRIATLKSELDKWQERLPPLIARFQERDADAKRLEHQLDEAQALIARYQQQPSFDETRAGAYPPGDPDAGSDASNDMLAMVTVSSPPPTNLRAVKGIGPATSRRLANIGFHQIKDLAEASDDDLSRIDAEIKGARGKASGWRKQAIALLEKHKPQ